MIIYLEHLFILTFVQFVCYHFASSPVIRFCSFLFSVYVDPVFHINPYRTEIFPKFVGVVHLWKFYLRTELNTDSSPDCELYNRSSNVSSCGPSFLLLRSLGRMSLTLHVDLKLFLLVCIACMWFGVFKRSLFNDLVFGDGVLQLVRRLVSTIATFHTNVPSLRE